MHEDTIKKLEDVCNELNGFIEKAEFEANKERRQELDAVFNGLFTTLPADDPAKADFDRIQKLYNKLGKAFSAGLFQLYQARDLERWEHYALKLKICEELNSLLDVPEDRLAEAAKRFTVLREQWQKLGSVPHEKADELWQDYRAKCTGLHKKLNAYFALLDQQRNAIDHAKEALVEQTEQLIQNPNYQVVTPKIKDLQMQWKNLGVGHIKTDRVLYGKFKALCDEFFNARNNFFAERKNSLHEAVSAKNAIIAEAMELAANPPENPRRSAQELYNRWRDLPYAGKEDQKLYTKFKTAVDSMFAVQMQELQNAAKQKLAWCDEVEQVAEKLASQEITLVQAQELYANLQKKFRSLPDNGREMAAEVQNRKKQTVTRLETMFKQLRTAELMAGANNRKALEFILAEGLMSENPVIPDAVWSEFAVLAGKNAVEELRNLAERPLDFRLKQLENYTKQRKFTVSNLAQQLGVKNSLADNVELLALALETAMRDSFSAAPEQNTTPEDLEQEFWNIPLAMAGELDKLYDDFEKALNKRG